MFGGAAIEGAATPEVMASVALPVAAPLVLDVSIASVVAVSLAVAVALAVPLPVALGLAAPAPPPLAVAVSAPVGVGAGAANPETLAGAFRPHPPDAADRSTIPSPTTTTIFTATGSV
jgi:hypothetical protein